VRAIRSPHSGRLACDPVTARRGSGRWEETALFVGLAGAVLLLIARPAFHAYFFGEAFMYLGQYWATHERFWRALMSPSGVLFFKPVSFATSVPWYSLLPADPWFYHARNFTFSIVNLLLLHRVLLRLVDVRWARALALGLFAVSKVHLTTIGYLMIFDSIVMLGLLLATVLCTLRWCATRSTVDYWCALLFCALCAFSKDYGVATIVVAGTVAADGIATRDAHDRWRRLSQWVLPLASIGVLRIGLRHFVAGPMPWSDPVYAPHFSIVEVARKGLVFASAWSNLSVGWHAKTGASGWGSLLAPLLPTTRRDPTVLDALDLPAAIDALAGLAILLILVATLWRTRVTWRRLVAPGVWVLAFFAPPLLTRNVQIYYAYEPLAGAAVLVGIVLAEATRRTLIVWSLMLAAIGVAGFASNQAAHYDWQFAADAAATIQRPVLQPYRGQPLKSLTFVTRDVPFWRWVLTADDHAPMLQFLLDRPDLPVRVLDRRVLADAPRQLNPAHVVLDADADFTRIPFPVLP